MKHKTVIVGAGPVGALAAIYAANRGHEVEVYELRDDLREPSTTPLNFTKSINLALSERGINAMKNANRSGLLDAVLEETIPMHGRMIHGKNGDGQIFEQSQLYDIHGRFQRAIDRAGLNKTLLDELDRMPNVKLFFNHKLTGADFKKNMAWFEQRGSQSKTDQTPEDERRAPEICISFDFLIGADGAHSATRFHMMKYARMFYQQEYIDTLWCEFQIPPLEGGQFKISPNHLHIWPGGTFMFIAIPSTDGSFTCTLFLPAARFAELEQVPASIVTFFRKNFPGVTPDLINPEQLQQQFESNPHLPLISLKCTPYHYKSSVVILGDAAHAMVPFYGQGMNAGLEDVRVLFELLDKHSTFSGTAEEDQERRASALEEYTNQRTPDAYAINNLALKNYQEMSSSVVSPTYKARKRIEEALSVWIPQLGWATQYARVSFGNMRYSEVEAAAQRQGKLLVRGILLSVLGIAWIASWGLWRVSKSADLRGPLSRALGGLVKTIRGRRG